MQLRLKPISAISSRFQKSVQKVDNAKMSNPDTQDFCFAFISKVISTLPHHLSNMSKKAQKPVLCCYLAMMKEEVGGEIQYKEGLSWGA